MRNLVPHFILERYNAGEKRGSFPAVGMFVDISGFSQITDELMEHGQHGAEVLADVMRNIFSPLVQITYEQGGFISTLAGDAFTAIYPSRKDAKNASIRALSAAWQIQQELQHLAVQVTPYGKFVISGKIGIALGDATWGIVSSDDGSRAAYYVTGSAVEESAIAEGKASSGQILVTSQFYSITADYGEFIPQKEHFKVSGLVTDPLPPKSIDRPSIDLNLAYKFYPPSLFDQVHSGEFRQVVTMFVNLPTVRTEDQLDIFMGSIFELQDKYGGLLTRLDFGDKGSNLLMFWGAPVSFENDIERALNLILELQTQTSIPINAGITYRIAHAGYIGSTIREEYSTYGRGVNLAARFMSTAHRGEIWVDEEIAKRAESKFEIELDSEYTFKGFSQKQMVYLLEERKEEVETLYQTALVGRQAELKVISDFIKPLSEDNYCGGLIILGDPGIGKTRLVNEFSNEADADFRWALCQCDQTIRASFHPISYWLRQYFSVTSFQNEARNKRNFNRKIDRVIASLEDKNLAAELDRTRSFLGALIDLYWPDSLYEQVDPQGRYDNTIIGLVALIRAESSFQPIILQLEDAQWLDEDSWNLLTQLDRTIKSHQENNYPLAIIATARLEFLSSRYKDGIEFQELRIGELPQDSLKTIAEQILESPVSEQLLDLLHERSDGNPFFAEQIIYYLQDEGKLGKENGEWVIRDQTQSPLPDNIRALLVSRIDRLAQEVKDVVLTAAVLGREFEIPLLSHMLEGQINLIENIANAEQNAIWSRISELRYLFTHALLLDAAYRMQVRSRRQALHKSAVQAIENLYKEEINSYSTDLAYHCEMAGLVDKARTHLLDAAAAAKGEYRNAQAIDLFSRALKFTSNEDFRTKYNILIEREDLFSITGQNEKQLKDLEELNQFVNSSEDFFSSQDQNKYRSNLAIKWANYEIESGEYQKAIESAQEIISISEQADIKGDLDDAYLIWAASLFRRGHFKEAADKGNIGYTHANAIDDHDGEIRLLNLLGMIDLGIDNPKGARDYFSRSLDLATKYGNLRDQARALNNLGNEALAGGNFNSAHDYYLQSLDLVRTIGDLPREGLVLINLGYIAGIMGDYLSARDFYDQSLRSARQVGNNIQEAYALINSSSVHRALGNYEESLSLANRGLTIARNAGDRNWEAWALTSLGNTHFELGNLMDSAESFKDAVKLRQSMKQKNLASEPLAGLARIAIEEGELREAVQYINPIIEFLEPGGTLDGTDEPILVYLTCYQVLHAAGDTRSKNILEAGHLLLLSRGAGIIDEIMRNNFYENIPHNKVLLSEWKALQN